MIIINGLMANEAVKFNDVYIVALNTGVYDVDGSDITIVHGRQHGQIMVADPFTIRRKVVPQNVVDFYQHCEDKSLTMSNDEMLKARYECVGKYQDEDYDTCWPDLDTEMACRKKLEELNKYKTVMTNPKHFYEDVEVNVIGSQEDTGSHYIETPYLVGQTKWSGGVYRVKLSHIAMNEYHIMVPEVDAKFENTTHSHLEYLKVNGEYALTKQSYPWVKQANAQAFYMTLEEAKEAEEFVRTTLRGILMLKVKKTVLEPITADEVYQEISRLYKSVGSLDVKVKADSDRRHIMTSLHKLKDRILDDSGKGAK